MVAARELGRGRLVLGMPDGRPQRVLRVDATSVPPDLLGRLLVGSYITGQDQVWVSARAGLTPEQRAEVRRTSDRLLGSTVVNDSPAEMEVEHFVDPSKYELPRLVQRVAGLLRDELRACYSSLSEGTVAPLEPLDAAEEEVDQLYLLMARQLLLSSDDPNVARDIHVVSHHYQIGYRLVAKVLEVTGDRVRGVGSDLQQHLVALRRLPPSLTHELALRVQRVHDVLRRTMEAFTELSVSDANFTLNRITHLLADDAALTQLSARCVDDPSIAAAIQRIVHNLSMALEMLIVVNEVTINRCVEPETVARSGSYVVIEAHEGHPTPPAVL